MPETPNCYNCQHRDSVPGSAHSSCNHPCYKTPAGELGKLVAFLNLSENPIPGMITVKGNSHGIRNGWFLHPLNFDPCWLEECSGFTPLEKQATDSNVAP